MNNKPSEKTRISVQALSSAIMLLIAQNAHSVNWFRSPKATPKAYKGTVGSYQKTVPGSTHNYQIGKTSINVTKPSAQKATSRGYISLGSDRAIETKLQRGWTGKTTVKLVNPDKAKYTEDATSQPGRTKTFKMGKKEVTMSQQKPFGNTIEPINVTKPESIHVWQAGKRSITYAKPETTKTSKSRGTITDMSGKQVEVKTQRSLLNRATGGWFGKKTTTVVEPGKEKYPVKSKE